MKKIGLLVKEKIVEELKEKVDDAQGYFFVSFSKVEAFSLNTLRNGLRDLEARILVAKNSLFKRALEGLNQQELANLLESETGAVFVYNEDVVGVCKALVDFAKENENLQIKGGFINKRMVTSEEVLALAKLPPKDIILGMAVSALASPLTGFLSSLNQIILKFIWTIEEIKKKK